MTNTWVLNYLTADERRAYVASLDELGADRDLSWVFVEMPVLGTRASRPTIRTADRLGARARALARRPAHRRAPRRGPSPRLLAPLGAWRHRRDPAPRLVDGPVMPMRGVTSDVVGRRRAVVDDA